MKIGLVLEGGANRGIFTSGVMDYLMEQGVTFQYAIGTSAGAGNVLNFLAGQKGRARDLTVAVDKRYRYFGWDILLKTGHFFDMENVFWKIPTEVNLFDFDTYFANPTEREFTATNCLTGEPAYLRDKGNDRKHLMTIGQASSALPGATHEVLVDGIPHADGGVADSISVRRAFEMGCDKVVVVETRRREFRMKPSKSTKFLAKRNEKKYPKFAEAMLTRPERYNETLDFIHQMEAEGKVLSIRPEMQEVKRLEKDYHKLMKFYHHGYQQAKKIYPELMKFMSE
ncbi:MAG: patatin family protein [Anaerotignum sp.]|nr:patatin family protein [Anaerotignum sp.]MBR5590110.1 patatin family protein [Anaerotignum sp.]